jgi:arginine decarboxylase
MAQGESGAGAPAKNKPHTFAKSLARYGGDRWGERYLDVNAAGHLVFTAPRDVAVDLHELAQMLEGRGLLTPFVVRFPTMIHEQVRRLRGAFLAAGREHAYDGGHVGVYPLKVNQRRAVVQAVASVREECHYGLEAGSKPELLLAMALPVVPGTPLLCNGYKDADFIRTAFHAAELGHEVVIVLESVHEVRRFLLVHESNDWTRVPQVGVRAKLYSRGSGRWQGSGGPESKFGLTTGEILTVVAQLEEAGRLDLLTLLHFHIGSQITQIKRVKVAVREGTRIWAELRQRCKALKFIDIGGGIGVDYDGSRTSFASSANYTVEEYASQVVYEIGEVCREVEVPVPTIVTESGRILVAEHSVTIADVREVQGRDIVIPDPTPDEHRIISELRYARDNSYLSLSERAAAEGLFQQVRNACKRIIREMGRPPEEIAEYMRLAEHKYLVNFSIFQSIPDAWSIDHVFPVAPLSRHGDVPEINAEIVDITCDSDGCVETFAHPDENLDYLPLHAREPGDRYYLGFFMTGAYQDSLANVHNLFSRCHEVVIHKADEEPLLSGSEMIELPNDLWAEVKSGPTVEDVLAAMDWDIETIGHLFRERHLARETTLGSPWAMGLLQAYPYLQDSR